MTNVILRGKPDAGTLHVWFEERKVAQAKSRRDPFKKNILSSGLKTLWVSVVLSLAFNGWKANASELIVDVTGERGAYLTIQAAVDAAQAGDVIRVYPGKYETGGKEASDDQGVNRVFIDKPLHLKSVSGAETTKIVGQWDPEGKAGVGRQAVRCVYVGASGVGTVIEGFTFSDGAAHEDASSDTVSNRAGGVLAGDATTAGGIYVVDCIFKRCSGGRGGAIRYGTAIRCRFVENSAASGTSVARNSVLANCLIEQNSNVGTTLQECTLVNCSICANGGDGTDKKIFGGKVNAYNCVMTANTDSPIYSADAKTCAIGCCCFEGLSSLTFNEDDMKSVRGASRYQFFAPLVGDYRLVSGAEAVGLGDPAWLTDKVSVAQAVVPIDLFRDLAGNTIAKDEAIDAGCYQGAVSPACGRIEFSRWVKAKGYRILRTQTDRSLWMYSEKPCEVFQVQGKTQPYRWVRGADDTVWPELDGSLWCVMPPEGMSVTYTVEYPSAIYNVAADGSEAYTTIQDALDKAAETPDAPALINVSAGDASGEGCLDNSYGNSRIVIGNQRVRILGAGAGESYISGALDGTGADGRGENGMRCVRFSSTERPACVQGFTLRNGRTKAGTGESNTTKGGLVFCPAQSSNNAVLDCVLTDGIAQFASAMSGGLTVRCEITGCSNLSGGVVKPGLLESCLIRNCGGGGNYILRDAGTYCSTVVLVDGSLHINGSGANNLPRTENSIFYGCNDGDAVSMNTVFSGNLVENFATYRKPDSKAMDRNTQADPAFVDTSRGDFRVQANSAALSCTTLVSDYWERYQTCLDGSPRQYVYGKPVAGALPAVQCLWVSAPESDPGCVISPSGPVAVGAGETVEITVTPSVASGRRVEAFLVDGVRQHSATGSYVYTAPADGEFVPREVVVKPVLNSDWYVSPTGSDSSDGWTADTPKKTLSHMMAFSRSGDVVHALPGTYSEGVTNYTVGLVEGAGGQTASRVLVPGGVTLVGEKGADQTIILGQAATSGADEYGCGTGAARCATVLSGGTLRGFTLTGGHIGVAPGSGSVNDDRDGGAVLARKDDVTALVADCVISNNVCGRGTCAGGKYVNCRIVQNRATATSGGLWYAHATGCYFNYNRCGSGQLMRFFDQIENCTIGGENYADNGTSVATACLANQNSGYAIVNSIVLTKFTAACLASNCVFVVGRYATSAQSFGNKEVSDIAGAKLDGNGVPQQDSVAVDFDGAREISTIVGTTDFFGVRRYYNGKLDVGAYEYDWRPAYARTLGDSIHLKVDASKDVVMGNGCLEVPAQAELQCAFAQAEPLRRTTYGFDLELLETGELRLSGNGEPLNAFVGPLPRGAWTCKAKNATDLFVFVYEGTGAANIYGVTGTIPGCAIIVR